MGTDEDEYDPEPWFDIRSGNRSYKWEHEVGDWYWQPRPEFVQDEQRYYYKTKGSDHE